ncbi:MAG: GntR family transcriptional regulator [Eubacterium sp.]|nr:GntR family transcriptional regulator [Eubacterium sp.]
MDIIISNSSGKPIYEQITTQIKNKIITGELRPGDALPSMRVLAKELRISVITTTRAYADLEQDGFIETAPGKGSFVAQKNTEFIREENYRQIQDLLEQAIDLSKSCGLTLSELTELITLLYKGDS